MIIEAATERGGEVSRLYAPMGKAVSAIRANYTAEELALIVDFLERAANSGAEAAAQVRAAHDGTSAGEKPAR